MKNVVLSLWLGFVAINVATSYGAQCYHVVWGMVRKLYKRSSLSTFVPVLPPSEQINL